MELSEHVDIGLFYSSHAYKFSLDHCELVYNFIMTCKIVIHAQLTITTRFCLYELACSSWASPSPCYDHRSSVREAPGHLLTLLCIPAILWLSMSLGSLLPVTKTIILNLTYCTCFYFLLCIIIKKKKKKKILGLDCCTEFIWKIM